MRWLRNEDGASMALVGVAMVALIGMAGFAVDVGAIYAERRELQNGADAAVLAVAEDCGRNPASCGMASATATAQQFADLNASDGAAGVADVIIDVGAQTVSVETETVEAGSGSSTLEPYFAQVVGFSGANVHARASAAWGAPGSIEAVPLIISMCEWNKFGGSPQEGPPFTGAPITILFHDGNTTEDCAAVAGQDQDGDGRLGGGFGWLDTGSGCEAIIDADDVAAEDPGASPSNGCSPSDFRNMILNQTIWLPIFDDLWGTGAGGRYHVAGIAALYVTGYNFGGLYKENPPCSGDERCIAGYFTTGFSTTGELGGPIDFGLIVVQLTG